MRSRHRRDANHADVRAAAERLGWMFEDTSQTHLGYDAILTRVGRTVRVEIKDGSKPMSAQKLTPHEADVHSTLRAHGVIVEILTCVEDLQMLSRPPRARAEG